MIPGKNDIVIEKKYYKISELCEMFDLSYNGVKYILKKLNIKTCHFKVKKLHKDDLGKIRDYLSKKK